MSPPPLLETPRLHLAPLSVGEVDALWGLFRQAGVRRYLLDGLEVEREWIEDEVRRSEERFADRTGGLFAAHSRATRALVGVTGFRPFLEPDPPAVQLLYAVDDGQVGKGLGSEMAAAAIEFAFTRLDHREVRATVDAPNVASGRVLERLGFAVKPHGAAAASRHYTLRREAWRR